MNHDELIDQLKAKAEAAGITKKFPPLSRGRVEECERELGFKLPALLKRVYSEVANGGVGPREELLGLSGGKLCEIDFATGEECDVMQIYEQFQDVFQIHEDLEDEDLDVNWEWPKGVLPICDWGDQYATVLDCKSKSEDMIITCFDQVVNYKEAFQEKDGNIFALPGVPLQQWLEAWISGDDKECVPAIYDQVFEPPVEPPRQPDQREGEWHGHYKLRKAAESGDAVALYEYAQVVWDYSRNADEAFELFKRSADQGHSGSNGFCAYFLLEGYLGKFDWDAAFEYAKKSSTYGFYLEEDLHVPSFYKSADWWAEAMRWWQARAEHNDERALYSLFLARDLFGRGNLETALAACQKSADLGYKQAQKKLHDRFLKEWKNIDGAQEKAVSILSELAEKDDISAKYQLWKHYSDNDRDLKKALKYLESAAKQKIEKPDEQSVQNMAAIDLAEIHLSGRNGKQNTKRAMKLLEQAAKAYDHQHKSTIAIYKLAMIHKNGEFVPRNINESIKWLRKGVERGCAKCMFELASCYETGVGVEQSDERAQRFFKIAADKGHKPSIAKSIAHR